MMQRAFFSAFATVLLSAVLVQTAAAYPTTARSATTTVTGAYRPLDLDLDTVVIGTNALNYSSVGESLSFQVDLTGTFSTPVGNSYSASGDAGIWRLVLSTSFESDDVEAEDEYSVITMSSDDPGLQVGTLTYLSGGDFPISGHPEDTPLPGDVFRLFSTEEESVLEVVCHDGVNSCENFDLTLLQDLAHIGPYNVGGSLDMTRLNQSCVNGNTVVPCGSVTGLTASSSVPEPATFALLGLGLAGLGLSRRARA